MTAYYNEIEPYAADWLENLIAMGEIAPGIVDRRSIEDVRPDELMGFTQCHFFAGIGVWSSALRLAGWPDDRPVWTGSCPCQPFSAAGKGGGIADERHLWPAWDWLIEHGKPRGVPILGEQVASKDGLGWLDIVSADLEGKDYACWPFDLCAAGFGSPNIRQRLFFAGVADSDCERRNRINPLLRQEKGKTSEVAGGGGTGGLDDTNGERGRSGESGGENATDAWKPMQACGMEHAEGDGREQRRAGAGERGAAAGCSPSGLANSHNRGRDQRSKAARSEARRSAGDASGGAVGRMDNACAGRSSRVDGHEARQNDEQRIFAAADTAGELGDRGLPGPTNSFWRAADWLFCRDGKWRPVEPGTFPLVDGAAFKLGSGGAYEGKSRAGMLKGYGNAINRIVAAGFIREVMQEIDNM